MGMEKAVGRVGALAVALGIGSAIGAMPGVAWAESEDSGASSSAQTSTGGSTGHVKSPNAESKDSGNSAAGAQVKGAGPGGDSEKSPTKKRGAGGDKHATAADSQGVTKTTDDDVATNPKPAHGTAKDDAAKDDAAEGDAADVSAPVLQPDSAIGVGVTPVGTEPTTEASPPTTPVAEPATVVSPLVSPESTAPLSPSGNTPIKPAEPPLLWTVLVSALREFGQQKSQSGTTSAPSTSAHSAKPSGSAAADAAGAAITGLPEGSVVVGADGTIYQVTRNAGSTRVSVIDSDGQVLSTTPDIAGIPNSYSRAVARPDGTLVLVTTNERGTRSTISVIDNQGTVTTLGTVKGQPQLPQVAFNGAVYFGTFVPTIFSLDGAADYRLVRVSPTNTLRSFSRGSLTLAPDGTAYEVTDPFFGVSTVLAIAPDGQTRRIFLPLGASTNVPIIGQDGLAYVTAGVRQLFGGQMTRLYTFDGTSSTVRSIRGLPGKTQVTADGVYLETYTYNPFTDNEIEGITYFSRITADSIRTSDKIDGRVPDFQVTPGGTVYAALYNGLQENTVVAVVDTDGGVTTVTVPGKPAFSSSGTNATGTGPHAGESGYVGYTSGSTTYLAVLNPDGTVARTITLPPNATTRGSVFFGPDGAAYQLVQYKNAQGQVASQSVLALSTDTYTPVLSGSPFLTSPDVQFGPDGTGYLITQGTQFPGVQVLGFNAAGATGVTFASPSAPAVRGKSLFDTAPLTFAPDGVAYIAVSGAADAGVYALTSTGATKVLDLQYSPSLSIYTPVVGADGTVYLTTAEGNSDNVYVTTVRTIAPATL